MKSIILLLSISWILLQWSFLSTEGLKCYKCVHYNGSVDKDHNTTSEKSCQVDGSPSENLLISCKNSTGSSHEKEVCGLVHMEGNYNGDKYNITVRDCIPMNEMSLGCSNLTNPQATYLLNSIGDPNLVRLKPSDAITIWGCTCDDNRCNANVSSAEAKAENATASTQYPILIPPNTPPTPSAAPTTVTFGYYWMWIICIFLGVLSR